MASFQEAEEVALSYQPSQPLHLKVEVPARVEYNWSCLGFGSPFSWLPAHAVLLMRATERLRHHLAGQKRPCLAQAWEGQVTGAGGRSTPVGLAARVHHPRRKKPCAWEGRPKGKEGKGGPEATPPSVQALALHGQNTGEALLQLLPEREAAVYGGRACPAARPS